MNRSQLTIIDKVQAFNPYERFVYYINERVAIRERRNLGAPQEKWTQDPILQKYKFTNARRAWDYTSGWLMHNWYKPSGHVHTAGMAAAFARFFCYVPTFEAVGFPSASTGVSDWLNRSRGRLNHIQDLGGKVFTSAYMIGGVGKGQRKVDWVIDKYLTPVHTSKVLRHPWLGTIVELHEELHHYNGWGDFLTQEVMLDLMQTFVLGSKLMTARKQYGYAGPGAIRGLNRLQERDVHAHMNRNDAQEEMVELWSHLATERSLRHDLRHVLTVHDVEFNLCEYDKYCRVLFGEGVPKQLFKPRTNSGELTLL